MYNIPLFIVENGFGVVDEIAEDGKIYDQYRINYLKAYIKEIRKYVDKDWVNLIGYTPWGCIDLG